MKETLRFLKELKYNNNRDWFAANRPLYDHARRVTDNLTTGLIAAVARVDRSAARLSVRDCTYRIYRDTRFSPDKTPYKNHIGIFINPPGGKKALTCGYYFHLEHDNCFFAAGTVCLPSKIVTAIRRSIIDNIEEYRGIVESPAFKEVFVTLGENPVKTAPRGVDRDWPWLDYVRPRDFVATTATVPSLSEWTDNAEVLHNMLMQAHRFNRFVNYAICDELGLEIPE